MDRRVLGYTGCAAAILATQCLIPASTSAKRANQPNGAPAPAAAPATPLPRAFPVTPGFQREPDAGCGPSPLPNGLGHPESSSLAGVPAAYIVGQMADDKKGVRKGSGGPGIMANLSVDDMVAIAAYTASRAPSRKRGLLIQCRVRAA
jgi:hypothetical protein